MDKLFEQINELKKPSIIAISGFGGSGKSTLAKSLAKELNLPAVSIDSFWNNNDNSSNYSNWEVIDFERFIEEVLIPFQSGQKEIEYGHFDWVANKVGSKNKLVNNGKIIVEGIGLFRPELLKYFDYKIWVNTNLETSLARGKKRDQEYRGNREDRDWDNTWDTLWKKNDQEFYDKYKPNEVADFVFENNL